MVQEQLFKVAEVEVSYRPDYSMSERPRITSSMQAFQILKQQWDDGRIGFLEEFKIILLNRRNSVLGVVDISMGGLSGTFVDPKIVFSIALKANCSSIILSHNHPSGSVKPSGSDIKLTERLAECGRILDIIVWDHLIISESHYYSFLDEGLM